MYAARYRIRLGFDNGVRLSLRGWIKLLSYVEKAFGQWSPRISSMIGILAIIAANNISSPLSQTGAKSEPGRGQALKTPVEGRCF